MKFLKLLLPCVFVFITYCMNAQTESEVTKDSIFVSCIQCDSLYNQICPPTSGFYGGYESFPEIPGGYKALFTFLADSICYPQECIEKHIEGRVFVQFIVTEEGKIICARIHRSLHPVLDKEALRVVNLMPNWQPASDNGVPLKKCYSLPITFKLDAKNLKKGEKKSKK